MDSKEKQRKDLDKLQARARNPEEFAAVADAIGDREREPGFLVVLACQKEASSPSQVEAFAKAMKLDNYTARQKLITPSARILFRYEKAEKAAKWVTWFREHQLSAFVVPEQELSKVEFQRTIAVFSEKEMLVFDDAKGERVQVEASKVSAIVFGQVQEKTYSETTNAQHDYLMTSFERDILNARDQFLVDVHFYHTPTSVRFEQDTFAFPLVFPGVAEGSSVLMVKLLEKLQAASPKALVYNGFKQAQDVLGQSEQLLSSSLFLSKNWMKPGARMKLKQQRTHLQSNAGAFDVYSTLARFEALER